MPKSFELAVESTVLYSRGVSNAAGGLHASAAESDSSVLSTVTFRSNRDAPPRETTSNERRSVSSSASPTALGGSTVVDWPLRAFRTATLKLFEPVRETVADICGAGGAGALPFGGSSCTARRLPRAGALVSDGW